MQLVAKRKRRQGAKRGGKREEGERGDRAKIKVKKGKKGGKRHPRSAVTK